MRDRRWLCLHACRWSATSRVDDRTMEYGSTWSLDSFDGPARSLVRFDRVDRQSARRKYDVFCGLGKRLSVIARCAS